MGISPKLAYDVEKRPFYVTRDGHGKAIPGVVHVTLSQPRVAAEVTRRILRAGFSPVRGGIVVELPPIKPSLAP